MKLTDIEIDDAWLRYLSNVPVCTRENFAAELQRVADRIPSFQGHLIDYVKEPQNWPGKTLRDEFAMATLTGLIADEQRSLDHQERAEFCYGQADAMLSERTKHSAIS